MEEKNKGAEGAQERKKGRPATGRTQKHISFRCDLDNISFLESKPNKGGFLNKLIQEARHREGWAQDCADMPPEPADLEP